MGKKFNISFLLMLSMLAASGCNLKFDNKANEDQQKAVDEAIRKAKEAMPNMEDFKVAMTLGGQPAKINVSGVAVKDDSRLSSRITVSQKVGAAKDGNVEPLRDYFKAKISSKIDSETKLPAKGQKSFLAIGCDERTAKAMADKRGLEVQKNIPDDLTGTVEVSYSAVMLCGDLQNMKAQDLNITADELILSSVDYEQIGYTGSINLIANTLSIIGQNKISMVAPNGEETYHSMQTLNLAVAEKLQFSLQGALTLSSVGSSYEEKAK